MDGRGHLPARWQSEADGRGYAGWGEGCEGILFGCDARQPHSFVGAKRCGKTYMRAVWFLLERVSCILEPAEREAVLGDLKEAGEGPWQTLVEIVGLVLRRQAGHWKDWRPWVAAIGVSVPTSFLLMGDSVMLFSG